ncbi:MAG TPA: HAD family hydrolase [Syntrophobacter fumaroxidans]|nr:HAD family hydrolase [Syntrophobacter fumaroxidans]
MKLNSGRPGMLAVLLVLTSLVFGCARLPVAAEDPLPSWSEGAVKDGILDFVARVSTPGGKDFVPVPERVAAFDNDGTLWAEQPIYFQVAFTLDRVKTLAAEHPEWRSEAPFKWVLDGDFQALFDAGEKDIFKLILATHAGMTTDEFEGTVREWLATARHPRFKRPYTECVYQPMVELLRYLRANGFKTFIVSGGWSDFMRPWIERVYGIPPDQVVGSGLKLEYEMRGGTSVLLILPEVDFLNDGAGKPVGIHRFIGRRPIFSFGNSDGDLQMLQWTAAGKGARFMGLVHHTDAEREWAYDRASPIGRLDKALDEAQVKGWTVVDMKRDWAVVFPTRGSVAARGPSMFAIIRGIISDRKTFEYVPRGCHEFH